jgi:ElaB/YqjD/DUF883 family membrane-anchored ribosome-binding protein
MMKGHSMETSDSSWADEASAKLGGLTEDLNNRLKDAGTSLRDIDEQARAFIKDSPLVALAAALAGGFLIGRLLSRR